MMLGSDILEVAIGVAFLFTLLAIVASGITEAISQLFAIRSRTLHKAVKELLGSAEARDELYAHPLIKALSRQGFFDQAIRRIPRPSYISSKTFATALTDLVPATVPPGPGAAIAFVPPATWPNSSQVDGALAAITAQLGPADLNLQKVREQIEGWFDETMDRVTGWYKRMTQVIVFLVAAVVVIAMNADAIRYAEALAVNPQVRAAVVEAADKFLPDDGSGTVPDVDKARDELAKLDFGVGWSDSADPGDPRAFPKDVEAALGRVTTNGPGWLITIFAVSLGAPFWFDALAKLANLRAAGTKPKKGDED